MCCLLSLWFPFRGMGRARCVFVLLFALAAGTVEWPEDAGSLLRYPGAAPGERPTLQLQLSTRSSGSAPSSLDTLEVPLAQFVLPPTGVTRTAWLPLFPSAPSSSSPGVEVRLRVKFETNEAQRVAEGAPSRVPVTSLPTPADVATSEWGEEVVAVKAAAGRVKVRFGVSFFGFARLLARYNDCVVLVADWTAEDSWARGG